MLYGALRFRLTGGIDERLDREAGRYDVRIEGQGTSFSNRGESSGVLRDGRWAPLHSASWVKIAGREGRTEIAYDYERRLVQYRSRSETFFLGRVRAVDDVVPLPPGVHVDDTMSAFLNHADGYWRPGPGGTLETRVVRRQREPSEGVEETAGTVRAEIAGDAEPRERAGGRGRTASSTSRRFSTWARRPTGADVFSRTAGRAADVAPHVRTPLTTRLCPLDWAIPPDVRSAGPGGCSGSRFRRPRGLRRQGSSMCSSAAPRPT